MLSRAQELPAAPKRVAAHRRRGSRRTSSDCAPALSGWPTSVNGWAKIAPPTITSSRTSDTASTARRDDIPARTAAGPAWTRDTITGTTARAARVFEKRRVCDTVQ